MGWLGPCRQLGMPLEYSIVIIILGVLSTRIARSYQRSCIASSMAITSEDNLNSYGGSNVSPLASLDAPPCYPPWTLQKHPPWRLTANFLHSCFGGSLQNEILGSFGLGLLRMALSKDNKNHLLVETHDAVTFISCFSADFEAVAKKNLCFPTIISEIWQCSPWAKRSRTDKSQKLEVFAAKGCFFLHPPKLAKAFWLNHWLCPFHKWYFSVARPKYDYLSISEDNNQLICSTFHWARIFLTQEDQ